MNLSIISESLPPLPQMCVPEMNCGQIKLEITLRWPF